MAGKISKNSVISYKIGFIGGGNMAKGICEGITSKGLISFEQVYVSGPHLDRLTWWTEMGAQVFTENGTVVKSCDVIFICVKPHILSRAVVDIMNSLTSEDIQKIKNTSKLYVSILAGVTLNTLYLELNNFDPRIIRVTPNTPMTVGEGCTLFSLGQTATAEDKILINKLLSVTGMCKEVPESLLNAAGALTGSGPAFVYMAIEALADGAVKMGVPRDLASSFAAQMVLGAAKMARDSGKHTAQLKDEVCSAGGTTIQGVHALEKGGMRSAFMDAIEMATRRADEMSKK